MTDKDMQEYYFNIDCVSVSVCVYVPACNLNNKVIISEKVLTERT